MRKPLKNEFSWSVSRHQLFTGCQRAYYYNHYGSWGGWEINAPERIRQTYILKNIVSMPIWVGSIIHDLIQKSLENFANTGFFPTAEQLKEDALNTMRTGWTQSVKKAWIQAPKKTNLFELYYGNGKNLPREMTDKIKERVLECIDNFAHSQILKEILATPFLNWKPIDKLSFFMINDLKVWCAIDFAYTDQNGILHIIDWKTGSERKETLRFQLACYAIYAMEKWHAKLESIEPHGVILNDGARVSNYTLSPNLIISAKDQILTSAQAMKAKLKDQENNVAEEDDFPCNPDEFQCAYCNFKEICPALNP